MKENIFTFIWLFLAAGAGIFLYNTSEKTYNTNKQIAALHKKIASERHDIAVLSAEWWHLTTPERLEKLAKLHLSHLQPVKGTQFIAGGQAQYKKPRIIKKPLLAEKTKPKTTVEAKAVIPKPQPKPVRHKKAKTKTTTKTKNINDISSLVESLLKDDNTHISKQKKTSSLDTHVE